MSNLIISNSNLPTTIEDLSKFVLVGREKLTAVRAEIRAIDKLDLAKEVREQKKQEAQLLGEALLDAEAKIGEMLKQIPKATKGNQYTGKMVNDSSVDNQKPKKEVLKDLGFNEKQAERFETLAENKEIIEQVKAEARENEDIPTRTEVLNKVKEKNKQEQIKKAKDKITEQTKQSIEDNRPLVVQMDCQEFISKMPYKYDLLITDPPYSTDVDDIELFIDKWLYKALDGLKDTGRAYIFIGAYPKEVQAYLNAKIPEHMKLEQILVWTYKNTLGNNPKDRYKLNYQNCLYYKGVNAPDLDCPITNEQWAVQEINAPDGRLGDRYHAWQKPLEIAERFIRHSTKEGDIVVDPFVCTGTFVIAANKLKRQSAGCDINIHNLEIAVERGCKLYE
jgi:DNA modification methylase